uniref:Mitochondrial import receptor subunit TOM70 n=1 Tax=Ciona savignyi TaxID=51511 RepID=H2YR20_CIOSA
PTWKIALAVGVPVVIAGVGIYYLNTSNSTKKSETVSTKKQEETLVKDKRIEPEGSSSPKQQPVAASPEVQPKTKFQEAQELKNEGNRLFKQGKYAEAIEKYSEAINVCPDNHKTEKSTYHQNKAAAMEKLELWEDVVVECSAAVKLNQGYVKALHRRSKAYEKLDKKENCLEDITTVCILEGFHNNSTMVYADSILKQIGKEKAEQKYKTRKPIMPSPLFIKQYFASFNDDLISNPLTEEQIKQSDTRFVYFILDINPLDLGYIRAKIALKEDRYSEVIEEYTPVTSYLNEALLLRGTFYLLSGNSDAAKPDLNRIIDTEDANPKLQANALIKRGSMSMQFQKPENAEADFVLAAKVDPENSDVFHHRGQKSRIHFITTLNKANTTYKILSLILPLLSLNILLDKVDLALADFDKCIELNQDFAMAHAQRCYTVYRQANARKDVIQMQSAMDKFNEIIAKYPNCSETYGLFAQAQTDCGNFQKADSLFQDAIKIEPDNATLYVHRGLLALQWKQDINTSVELISKALEIDSKCDFAHETMGTIEVQRGNLEKACKHFEVSIDYAKSELEMAHLFALQAAAHAQCNIAKKYGLRPPMP